MEFLFPWGAFLRKTGGVISGNLTVNGILFGNGPGVFSSTLSVTSNVIINGPTTMFSPLTIIHDSISFVDYHIAVQSATGAGTVQCILSRGSGGAPIFGFCSTTTPTMDFIPLPGTEINFPSTILIPDPPIQFPLMSDELGVRRAMLLHGVMFG